MLNAIINGKAGRIHIEKDADSLSWSQLYKQREDLLTAAFFSRFTYLSGLLQHRLLKSWLGGVGDFTAFKSVEFWPRYDLPDDELREFVEPDLLLRFDDCDVLVEVKPPQGGMQYHQQWRKQIEGYFAQEEDTHELYFLAIGQVGNALSTLDIDSLHDKYELLKTLNTKEWKSIAHQLYQLQKSHKLDAQDRRVLKDMLQALELYGIRGYELKWSHLEKLYTEQSLDQNAMNAWIL
jgi:hypothetical protein